MTKILSMIWIVISMVIFILTLPWCRKEINAQPNDIGKLSICKNESIFNKLEKEFVKIFFCFIVAGILFYTFIDISAEWWIFLLEWCQGIFFVSFFPLFIGRLKEKEERRGNVWDKILILFGLLTSVISYIASRKKLYEMPVYRTVISFCLAVFVSTLICILFQLFIEGKKGSVKRSKVNIYQDLLERTPKIEVEKESAFELVKLCERFYYDFSVSIQKVKAIKQIQFINIFGIYKEYWYERVAKKMKIFFVGSVLIVSLYLVRDPDIYTLISTICISVFFGCVLWLKKYDKKFLIRLALRFVYGEWGYCILYTNKKGEEKYKVVGHVQLIEIGKYHRFIHDILNIAALGRTIAYNDKLNNTTRIQIFTDNMYELSRDYNSSDENTYIRFLPLWISLLFEFFVSECIHNDSIKNYLQELNMYEKHEDDIRTFLYGFWNDITRKNPCWENDEFISDFMAEVIGCNSEGVEMQ